MTLSFNSSLVRLKEAGLMLLASRNSTRFNSSLVRLKAAGRARRHRRSRIEFQFQPGSIKRNKRKYHRLDGLRYVFQFQPGSIKRARIIRIHAHPKT